MLKRFFERLFRGERGEGSCVQDDKATQAQIAYLEALEKRDRESGALPSNFMLPPKGES